MRRDCLSFIILHSGFYLSYDRHEAAHAAVQPLLAAVGEEEVCAAHGAEGRNLYALGGDARLD